MFPENLGAEDFSVPPQDIDAERCILGAMMLSQDVIADMVERLKSTNFYKPAHETIYDTICELYSKGEPADAITVKSRLEDKGIIDSIGGAQYLHTLIASVPTISNTSYYAKIVKDKFMLRELIKACNRIIQLSYSTDGEEVSNIVNRAQSEIYALSLNDKKEDCEKLDNVLESTIRKIEDNSKNNDSMLGVPTGFIDLDKLTGGLQGGQMIIVAARPGVGKSTLGLDFCRYASVKKKIPSVIFSLEMSKEEIATRLISAEGNILLSNLKRGGELKDENWTTIAEVLSNVNDAPLYIDDSANLTMNEIRAKCRRLKQRENIQLVVIDYLQLMSSDKKFESRQQEVSELSRSIKLLAKELNIPIIAIAQLNRGVEQRADKKPMMSDLRESGSLEQDADVIMLLNRPSAFGDTDRKAEADIIVAKHRNGETRTIPVIFQGHYSKFNNLAKF